MGEKKNWLFFLVFSPYIFTHAPINYKKRLSKNSVSEISGEKKESDGI